MRKVKKNQITIISLLSVTFILLSVIFILKLSAADYNLSKTSWKLISWDSSFVSNYPLQNSTITAQFNDNVLTGSSGCNQYIASYEINDTQLMVNASISSRKLCSEVLMLQESNYLDAIQNAQSYEINSENELKISYKGEENYGVMTFLSQN